MKKKLIVIGIAAALAAPLAAQAGVEVYGDARVSLDWVNNNDATAGKEDNALSLSSNYSNIGFRGDEDLGGGLSVLWKLEQEIGIDTGTFGGGRDTYVGLGGSFGTVLGGHMRTPYRAATEVLDPFANTRADYNAVIGSFAGAGIMNDEARTSNTISYMTPDMGGFRAALAYMLANTAGTDDLPMTTTQSDQDAWSLSADYNNGPIFASVAYETLSGVGGGGDDVTAWKIGGSYTIMDATTIGALYENIDAGGAIGDRNAWGLSVSHRMGSTTLMAAYNAADDTSVGNDGANQFSIGVKQALSKSTEVYALYTQVGNDNAGAYRLDNYNPGNIGGSPVIPGEDMSAFSFGINHMFSSK